MKKINLLKIQLFSLIMAVLAFVSCTGTFAGFKADDNDVGLSKIVFSIKNNSARNINPNSDVSTFTDFVLTGQKGETSQNLGSWATAALLSEASVSVEPGEWNLTLTAKNGDATFRGTATVTAAAAQTATAEFLLLNTEQGNGSVNITVTYPAGSLVNSASVYLSDAIDSDSDNGAEFNLTLDDDDENACGTLTSTQLSFTKELPAGRYMLYISFVTTNSSLSREERWLGNYLDYVTVEPGLETSAQIAIDKFERRGISYIESTENGVAMKVEVPIGTENVKVYRKVYGTNDWTHVANKYYGNGADKVKKTKTLDFTDHYGLSRGTKYVYKVEYNWWQTYGLEYPVEALYDGWDYPVFTTKPVVVYDAENTCFRLTNNPVIQWNGEEDSDTGYAINLCYADVYPYLTPTIKVASIDPDQLDAGVSNPISYCIITVYENEELNPEFALDPEDYPDICQSVQGLPCARPVDQGIKIKFKAQGNGTYYLKRATSQNGTYTTVETFRNTNSINYVDKYGLTEGQTYYYRIENTDGSLVSGSSVYSATSPVTSQFAASYTITSTPAATVSGSVITFANHGNITLHEESLQNKEKWYEYTYSIAGFSGKDVQILKYQNSIKAIYRYDFVGGGYSYDVLANPTGSSVNLYPDTLYEYIEQVLDGAVLHLESAVLCIGTNTSTSTSTSTVYDKQIILDNSQIDSDLVTITLPAKLPVVSAAFAAGTPNAVRISINNFDTTKTVSRVLLYRKKYAANGNPIQQEELQYENNVVVTNGVLTINDVFVNANTTYSYSAEVEYTFNENTSTTFVNTKSVSFTTPSNQTFSGEMVLSTMPVLNVRARDLAVSYTTAPVFGFPTNLTGPNDVAYEIEYVSDNDESLGIYGTSNQVIFNIYLSNVSGKTFTLSNGWLFNSPSYRVMADYNDYYINCYNRFDTVPGGIPTSITFPENAGSNQS